MLTDTDWLRDDEERDGKRHTVQVLSSLWMNLEYIWSSNEHIYLMLYFGVDTEPICFEKTKNLSKTL